MKGDCTFPKNEKLKSLIKIKELFKKGSSFYLYPFRLLLLPPSAEPVRESFPKVLVSVPKKRFKRAVDRNRIKRLIREIYRTHKTSLSSNSSFGYLGITYVGTKEEAFPFMEKRFEKLLQKMQDSSSKETKEK